MTAREWGFLIDENLEKQTTVYLTTEDIKAEHVSTALWPGANDFEDILPYACEEDLIIVTNNILDFKPLQPDAHAGLVIVYNNRLSAFQVATGLFKIVTAYQHRDAFPEKEVLDEWI
jgi:hypothetical protein